MHAQDGQEVILHRQEVQQGLVAVPGGDADEGAGDGVEDEVVRRGDDGGEDDGRVDHAGADDGKPLPEPASDGG